MTNEERMTKIEERVNRLEAILMGFLSIHRRSRLQSARAKEKMLGNPAVSNSLREMLSQERRGELQDASFVNRVTGLETKKKSTTKTPQRRVFLP